MILKEPLNIYYLIKILKMSLKNKNYKIQIYRKVKKLKKKYRSIMQNIFLKVILYK